MKKAAQRLAGRPLSAEIPGPAGRVVDSMAFDGDGNLLVLRATSEARRLLAGMR